MSPYNRCGLVDDDVFRSLFDYVWKPKTVEDSIDAGVHPAVAELRRREADKQRTVTEPRPWKWVLVFYNPFIGVTKTPVTHL